MGVKFETVQFINMGSGYMAESNLITTVHYAFWIFIFTVVGLPVSGGDILFRVSPGGDGIQPSGLWGGHVIHGGTGREEDLFMAGYGGLGQGEIGGLRIESASYDPVSQSVLLLVDDSGQSAEGASPTGNSGAPGSILTSAYGPLCAVGDGALETLFLRTRLADPDNPYLMDSECGIKCGWGPFAAYAGKVYFILSGVFGRSPAFLTRRIQLRVLEGCEDELERAEDGEDVHDFDVVGCSRLLATLHTESYVKPNPRPTVWTTTTLAAFMVEEELHIFLQMFDITGSDDMIKLMRYSSKTNTTEQLHQTTVQSRYASNLRVKGSGSVDYKNGVLCWSATDRLLCSLYSSRHPLKVATALEAGSAVKAGICTGSLPVPELVNSITGVAIAETEDSLSVYFGCYSDIAGVGGLGMVTVTHHGLSYTLTRMSSGPTTVYGGSLFLARGLSYYCPGATTARPSSSTSAAAHHTNVINHTDTTASSIRTTHASSITGDRTTRRPAGSPSQAPSIGDGSGMSGLTPDLFTILLVAVLFFRTN